MNRRITYPTQGTCSRFMDVELDEQGVIRDVVFTGGCHGNLQGISSLVKGQKAENVISRIEGIRCGNKSTSCPDQLAKALRKAME